MYPIFISDDPDAEEVISSLPGQKRWGVNKLEGFLGPLVKKGLKSVILFGVPMKMKKVGSLSISADIRTSAVPLPTLMTLQLSSLSRSSQSSSPSFSWRVTFASANTRPMVTAASCLRSRTLFTPTSQLWTPRLLPSASLRSPWLMLRPAHTASLPAT